MNFISIFVFCAVFVIISGKNEGKWKDKAEAVRGKEKVQDMKGRQRRTEDEKELILVHAFWRRSLTDYFEDPNSTNGRDMMLDPEGKAAMFTLGTILQEIYTDTGFLNVSESDDQTSFHALDDNFALTDVQAVQAGMLPSSDKTFVNVKGWPSHWAPVSFHAKPKEDDYILSLDPNCLPFYQARSAAVSSFIDQSDKQTQDLYNKLIANTGLPKGTTAAELYRGVVSISATEPIWYKSKDNTLKILRQMAKDETKAYANSTQMIRFKAGPILQQIIDRMKFKANVVNANLTEEQAVTTGQSFMNNLRFYSYTQVDATDSAVSEDFWQLSALTGEPIPYDPAPSAILYELWRVSNNYYVKVLYCSTCNKVSDLKELNVQGCPKLSLCPLPTFEQSLSPYLGISSLKQRQAACGLQYTPPKILLAVQTSTVATAAQREDFSILAIIFGIVVGVLVVVCVNLFYMLMTQRRQEREGYVIVDERSSLIAK